MTLSPIRIASLSLATVAAPAYAAPGDARMLDLDRSGGCELSIASAGKAMLLRASGLIPGETYRFTLTNGDMKPVAFSAYADSQGGLIQYYIPMITRIQTFSLVGGTSLLIVVGVALDTMQNLESHLVMRNYEGFIKPGGRTRSRTSSTAPSLR